MSLVKNGFVLWFTGLSGAGKSTLSGVVAERLRARECRVELLDGDDVRANLSKDLGFSKADRDENIRRIGFVARLLARNGVIAITAAISPYRAARADQRAAVEADGAGFCEVYMECPLEVLAERDVKGLYRQAREGKLAGLTGVSDPYEPPEAPEVVVRSDRDTVEQGADRVLSALVALGLLAPEARRGAVPVAAPAPERAEG